jgi:predicted GIY-YIG superfamily endonuclease
MITYTVYALCDPTGDPRYVGVTENLNQRFRSHLAGSAKAPSARWIRVLRERGERPRLIVLEEDIPGVEEGAAREAFWIAVLRRDGHRLLNRPLWAFPQRRHLARLAGTWAD